MLPLCRDLFDLHVLDQMEDQLSTLFSQSLDDLNAREAFNVTFLTGLYKQNESNEDEDMRTKLRQH